MGRTSLKWVVRAVVFATISIAYLVWREAAAKFGSDNLLMASYRGITLGVAFIVLWIWTNKIDGSHSKFRDVKDGNTESPYFGAVVTLIVCISLGVGSVAYHYLFTQLTGNLTDPFIAKGAGIVAFIFFTVVALIGLFSYWDEIEPREPEGRRKPKAKWD